jgi:hypothetical protein
MKFFNFFLLLWVIFALLDPDPDSESGATDPIESGSNPDPDPQPCLIFLRKADILGFGVFIDIWSMFSMLEGHTSSLDLNYVELSPPCWIF